MVYQFKFVSDEVDNFVRVIEADSTATFLDLHRAILNSVGYSDDQITSFFICNDDWEKLQEITLVEMDASSEYDNMTMADTRLEDQLGDEGQKLLYIFDPMFERAFFGQLNTIITGRTIDTPHVLKQTGKAPKQLQDADNLDNIIKDSTHLLDDDFFGADGYNDDELDDESFSSGNLEDLEQY